MEQLTKSEEAKIEVLSSMEESELKEITLSDLQNEIKLETAMNPLPTIDENEKAKINHVVNSAAEKEQSQSSEISKPAPVAELTNNDAMASLITHVGNFAIPPLLSMVAKKMLKKDIEASKMKAEKDELKQIEQAWKNYLATQPINLTPAQQLAVALGGVYGTKLALAMMTDEQDKEEQRKAVKNDIRKVVQHHRPPVEGIPLQGTRLPSGKIATRKAGETRGRKPRGL